MKNDNRTIDWNASVQEAMERITDNQRGAVIVVDDSFCLQGVVSDGDIRRAMLRGATLFTPVAKILNPNAVSITEPEAASGRAQEIFQKESSINILPVVNENNQVVAVAIRNPGQRKTL